MAYVYRHIRLDTNEVFYIGIGSDSKGKYTRAYSKDGRNKYWKRIVNKTLYGVEIIEDSLTWDFACEREKYWIKLYGRKDLNEGILVNMTDGGESTLGWIPSEITKQKQSKAKIGKYFGKDNPMFGKKGKDSPFFGKKHTKESRKKISDVKKGERHHMFGKTHTEEARKKISSALKGEKSPMYGKKFSIQTKKKISDAAKARFVSEETKQRLRTLRTGMLVSEETRKKMSESAKNRVIENSLKLECPYCGVKANILNAKRWHFDNCRHINLEVSG